MIIKLAELKEGLKRRFDKQKDFNKAVADVIDDIYSNLKDLNELTSIIAQEIIPMNNIILMYSFADYFFRYNDSNINVIFECTTNDNTVEYKCILEDLNVILEYNKLLIGYPEEMYKYDEVSIKLTCEEFNKPIFIGKYKKLEEEENENVYFTIPYDGCNLIYNKKEFDQFKFIVKKD